MYANKNAMLKKIEYSEVNFLNLYGNILKYLKRWINEFGYFLFLFKAE